MNLSYQEKRIWINLVTQLVVYAVYFYELWRGNVTPMSLLGVIVAIIVLQVVLQIALTITSRKEPKDERDVAVERSAYRNAYHVLMGCLLACLVLLSVHAFTPALREGFRPSPFHMINLLLFVLLLAEAGKLLSQLVLYRKLA